MDYVYFHVLLYVLPAGGCLFSGFQFVFLLVLSSEISGNILRNQKIFKFNAHILYDSFVWPVIAYGAALWGDRTFACIDAVQNRAMRFYLSVGRYTPTAAVAGNMGWEPIIVKQWKCVGSFWSRLCNMDNSRLTKKIFFNSFHQMINVKTGHTEYMYLNF